MGSVLRDQGSYFSILAEFVDSGCLRDLSPSAVKLYVALFYLAQKHTAVRLEVSNAEFQSVAGLDTKSIQSARGQLCEQRLIDVSKGPLGVYTYILFNPKTRQPLPTPTGRTGVRRYHSPPKSELGQPNESPPPNSARFVTSDDTASRSDCQARPGGSCCRVCKGTEFWLRGNEQMCARCHPDPRAPMPNTITSIPTAEEIGF